MTALQLHVFHLATPLLFVLVQPVISSTYFEVPKPVIVGVIRRIPRNHTLTATVGKSLTFGCELRYPTVDTNATKEYWWERDHTMFWHSLQGPKEYYGLNATILDFMSLNRTILLRINSVTVHNYGYYKCVFGDKVVQSTTTVCVGSPTWDQLRMLCMSKLAKQIEVVPTPSANPVLVDANSTLTLSCRAKPYYSKYLSNSSFARYFWAIGENYQIWYSGKRRDIAPPGSTFFLDQRRHMWNMTIRNGSLLFGRMPKCMIQFSRLTYAHSFAIVEAPRPKWVKDWLPTSGYFGVFLIFLMIWMLLAVNKTG